MTRILRILSYVALVVMTVPSSAAGGPDEPNITGVWAGMWGAPDAFVDVDPELLPPQPEEPVYTPEYQAKYDAIVKARSDLVAGNKVAAGAAGATVAQLETTCLPYGMPTTMMGLYDLEFLQTPGQVTILSGGETRRIYLDRPQVPLDDVPPGYWGRSVGRWEGNILLIDTIGIKPEVIGTSRVPVVHSIQMRIAERIRLIAPDLLQNEITITDPLALRKPWVSVYLMRKVPSYEMPEYVCDNIREAVDESGNIIMKPSKK